jgi:hypothetical protein|uniref:Endonuclease n=1 Tax=Podoviridae sp. ct8Lf7 TaxID=2827723 RepID=A0A8S5S0S5_9CAUD|nr:MAG TPA: endonuclease [Podoviridae sp. ct8Lf7]
MKRKIVKKLSKEQKSLLIALLLGDGTISSNYVFKLSHSEEQREFLKWKHDLATNAGFKLNGIKEYVCTCGYNKGKCVLYTQFSINPTIKALRRTVYIPKKTITRKLLNWLTPQGIAIWYMDDGCINVNTSKQRSSIQHSIRIAACVNKETAEEIVKYFLEVWSIQFRLFHEGKETYSIVTSSEEDCKKFVNVVKPYIEQVPSLKYKIRNNFTKQEFLELLPEVQDTYLL